MTTIGQIERITQDRVVALFQTHLGYEYLGNWEDRENNGNIETEILHQYLLKKGYSKLLIIKAIHELTRAATQPEQEFVRPQQRCIFPVALWRECKGRGRRKHPDR